MTPRPSKISAKEQQEPVVVTDAALVVQAPNDLEKPTKDTQFAQASAKLLVDIIKRNNWSKRLGGQSEHIQYEGWQTAGKYYGYAVKTFDAEYVEYGNTWGFKAKAVVVNEHTGIEVGGAEAFCMNDENNWKNKPKFQLASMAQTRAGSKALRQILGFVVALAGYNPTPVEEMDQVYEKPVQSVSQPTPVKTPRPITGQQKILLLSILGKKGKNVIELTEFIKKKFNVDSYQNLTDVQADFVIKKLESMPDVKVEEKEAVGHFESPDNIEGIAEPQLDMDEIDKEISK